MAGTYGQYCPLAMASEILGNRWTLLVLRELLDGSTTFNDISRGVPLMSRTLLAARLRELVEAGLLVHDAGKRGAPGRYGLAAAGQALGPVVRALAVWGQEWIESGPALEKVDVRFLMWDMRRNVRRIPGLPPRFTVRFAFTDAPEGLTEHWLVIEEAGVDLCYVDPGHEVDVHLECDLRTMARVWMGARDLASALGDGSIVATGAGAQIRTMRQWLGLSALASIGKRPGATRVRMPARQGATL